MLLQMVGSNFHSNASCFSLLLLYLANSQVSVCRTIDPLVINSRRHAMLGLCFVKITYMKLTFQRDCTVK